MTEPPSADAAPTTTRVIDSAAAIRAIADPLRVRLLQLLMVARDRTWSVKEMAAELNQPVTKLYHHVKLLEAAELISDAESRIVSGIVEHRYRANQRSLRFDHEMFGSPETLHDSVAQVSAVLESVRDDLVDYLYREDADFGHITISRATTRLTPEEMAELTETVEALVARFQRNRDDADRVHLPRTSMLFVLNPLGHDPA